MSLVSSRPQPVLTPCIGICDMAADGYCRGCARSLDEIAQWGGMDEARRADWMATVLPAREAQRG